MADAARKRRIHLTSVGSAAHEQLGMLGVRNPQQLLARARASMGDRFRITANARLIWASEDDEQGGRHDDAARARELERILRDDDVIGLVTIRGGAWFMRLIDRIDWDVLKRRTKTLYLFGFSEMTPLIGIAGRSRHVVGLYDMGPGFLYGGLKRYALNHFEELGGSPDKNHEQRRDFAASWAAAEGKRALVRYFKDVAALCAGGPSDRVPRGRLLTGRLPARTDITVVGGNLSLAVTLLGSRHRSAIDRAGTWLALEDVNEPLDNVDRLLAALKLAGLFERIEGLVLGDFHKDNDDQARAVEAMLKYHLPTRKRVPVVRLDNFGHIYPMAPLPLHRRVTLHCRQSSGGHRTVTIEIPWSRWHR